MEYRLKDVPGAEPIYRLITTILNPKLAPAKELAALYHERWEIETALDELKNHLRGAQIVLRSKTPELVQPTPGFPSFSQTAASGVTYVGASFPGLSAQGLPSKWGSSLCLRPFA
jgi:hypothetical protein